jgi:hypothetical protein
MIWSAGCSFLRAEGFFCNLDVVYGGLGISNVNDIETEAQTFRYRCLLSERKQNVLIRSMQDLNGSRPLWFGPKFFFSKVGSFPFWPKDSGTKQNNMFWSRNCLRQRGTFLFNPKVRDRIKTFWCGAKTFFSTADLFCFVLKIFGRSKTIWFGPKIVSGKAERF